VGRKQKKKSVRSCSEGPQGSQGILKAEPHLDPQWQAVREHSGLALSQGMHFACSVNLDRQLRFVGSPAPLTPLKFGRNSSDRQNRQTQKEGG